MQYKESHLPPCRRQHTSQTQHLQRSNLGAGTVDVGDPAATWPTHSSHIAVNRVGAGARALKTNRLELLAITVREPGDVGVYQQPAANRWWHLIGQAGCRAGGGCARPDNL